MRDINRVLDNLIKLTVAGHVIWHGASDINGVYLTTFKGMQIMVGGPNIFLLFTTFMSIYYPLVCNKTYRNFKITRLYFMIRKHLKPIEQGERQARIKREREALKSLTGS